MSGAPLPKPARRGPKPRRRIPRVSAHGRRRRTSAASRGRKADVLLADRLWALLVREAPQGMAYGAHAHHLIGRANRRVRWDLANGAWITAEMHEACHRGRWHKNKNTRLALLFLGIDGWNALRARAVQDVPEAAFDAVVRLRDEVVARGLEAQAREKGLL